MSYVHFTCHHSAESINRTLVLRPHPQPVLAGLRLTWFTTLESAPRKALGLTSTILDCDRMSHRYRVVDEDEHLVLRWGDLKAHPSFTGYLAGARKLEGSRGTRPGLWAVALEPVRVLPID